MCSIHNSTSSGYRFSSCLDLVHVDVRVFFVRGRRQLLRFCGVCIFILNVVMVYFVSHVFTFKLVILFVLFVLLFSRFWFVFISVVLIYCLLHVMYVCIRFI